jgi:hypothetical protein
MTQIVSTSGLRRRPGKARPPENGIASDASVEVT